MHQIVSLLIFFIIFLQSSVIAQDSTRTMRSFIPQSKAYDLYYPLDFKLLENEGIVTITDTLSGFNITVSSYSIPDEFEDNDIITLLNSFINENYNKQHSIEDWNSYRTKFENLVELKTYFENSNWIWFGINNKTSLVIISINKEDEISQNEVNLVKFMIDNLIIN